MLRETYINAKLLKKKSKTRQSKKKDNKFVDVKRIEKLNRGNKENKRINKNN